MDMGKRNGRNLWSNVTRTKMGKLTEYDIFKDLGKDSPSLAGYKKIWVHLMYDVNHDRHHKTRLVPDGHLTDIPGESVYSGVVYLCGI